MAELAQRRRRKVLGEGHSSGSVRNLSQSDRNDRNGLHGQMCRGGMLIRGWAGWLEFRDEFARSSGNSTAARSLESDRFAYKSAFRAVSGWSKLNKFLTVGVASPVIATVMGRWPRVVLLVSTGVACWLGMQAVHEVGHVLGALFTRGTAERAYCTRSPFQAPTFAINQILRRIA